MFFEVTEIISILVFVLSLSAFFWQRTRLHLKTRFKPVVDIDNEVERARVKHSEIIQKTSTLRTLYVQKKEVYDRLIKEVAIYD